MLLVFLLRIHVWIESQTCAQNVVGELQKQNARTKLNEVGRGFVQNKK
jgi:hypothetical protein